MQLPPELELDDATLLAHDEIPGHGPIVPPIHQTSLFAFASYDEMVRTFSGELRQPIYSRGDNPTVQLFEGKVASLERGEAARAFASGMAAISAAILAHVRAGERIVCVRHVYPDAFRLMRRLLPRLGIETVFVDGRDLAAVEQALPGASLLYLESPTSVVFDALDLEALAGLARRHGVVTICDNSWATPLFQRPLELGVDLVVHSASKYLSGHSDTVAGIAVGGTDAIRRINELTYPFLGGKLSPFEAFLLVRGLRTLELRLARHQATALTLARRLADHPLVERVNHPGLGAGLPPGLAGTTGLFSIELAPAVDVPRFCDALRLFRLGVSWGGHESLVFPAMIGLRQAGAANSLVEFGVPERLVRLHAGLEAPEALISDLGQALEAARVR